MKKIFVLVILGFIVLGLLAGTILACNEDYNSNHKHFKNNYNKWGHYHKWKEHWETPKPAPLPDYCNLGVSGPGNVYGKVINSSIERNNVSDFPLIITCVNSSNRIRVTSDEYGNYAVNFEDNLCTPGDIIEIEGYRYTYGGINTGIMSENGVCLNLIVKPL